MKLCLVVLAGFKDEPSTEEVEEVKSLAEKKADEFIKKKTSHWKPITYNDTAVHAYLLGKPPYDYATARKGFDCTDIKRLKTVCVSTQVLS